MVAGLGVAEAAALADTPGMMPALVLTLQSHGTNSPSVRANVARIFAASAISESGSAIIAATDGAVEGLVQLLQLRSADSHDASHAADVSSEGAMVAVADALVSLSAHSSALPVLIAAGAIEEVAAFLVQQVALNEDSWNTTLLSQATTLVANSGMDDGAVGRFIHANGIQPLVRILHAENVHVVSLACQAACTVSMGAAGASALYEAHAIPALIRLLAVSTDAAVFGESTGWTLRNLCRVPGGLQAFTAADGRKALHAALQSCNVDSRESNHLNALLAQCMEKDVANPVVV
jgi:hypothetical protein